MTKSYLLESILNISPLSIQDAFSKKLSEKEKKAKEQVEAVEKKYQQREAETRKQIQSLEKKIKELNAGGGGKAKAAAGGKGGQVGWGNLFETYEWLYFGGSVICFTDVVLCWTGFMRSWKTCKSRGIWMTDFQAWKSHGKMSKVMENWINHNESDILAQHKMWYSQ